MQTSKVHDQIYQILKERHMNQAAVARAAGIQPKLFNNILRGRKLLKPEMVVPICKALGCTPNELFDFPGAADG